MRDAESNKIKMWYALYEGKEDEVDKNGDFTGNQITKYSAPVQFRASASSGKGSAEQDVFGMNLDFTRSICSMDMSLPITGTSLVWIESEPVVKEDGSADENSADYVVAAPPAVSLDSIVIALKARKK